MALPKQLQGLRLPVVASPLFIISNPDLVIAQCKAGIVGSFPALNAREAEGEPPLLEAWLKRITEELPILAANVQQHGLTKGGTTICAHNPTDPRQLCIQLQFV